jgi:hypothetical protein
MFNSSNEWKYPHELYTRCLYFRFQTKNITFLYCAQTTFYFPINHNILFLLRSFSLHFYTIFLPVENWRQLWSRSSFSVFPFLYFMNACSLFLVFHFARRAFWTLFNFLKIFQPKSSWIELTCRFVELLKRIWFNIFQSECQHVFQKHKCKFIC